MRPDVTFLGIPVGRTCSAAFGGDRERTLEEHRPRRALAALLGMDMALIAEMLRERFTRKAALLDASQLAIERPLEELSHEELCPGATALDALMEEFR